MDLIRTLEYTLPGVEEPRSITVRVGAPEPDPQPGGDFRVLVEIKGFAKPYQKHFFGVDPIQALLLGLRIVPDIIPSLAEPGSRVTWLGEDDLGFRYGASPEP
jgi:hypothetical protein